MPDAWKTGCGSSEKNDLASREDHPGAPPHPTPKPAASLREVGPDVLQCRSRGAAGGPPGPPDDLGASSREMRQAQEPADTVQCSALAVGAAHALYSVASSEGSEAIPSSTLQETLIADLA